MAKQYAVEFLRETDTHLFWVVRSQGKEWHIRKSKNPFALHYESRWSGRSVQRACGQIRNTRTLRHTDGGVLQTAVAAVCRVNFPRDEAIHTTEV